MLKNMTKKCCDVCGKDPAETVHLITDRIPDPSGNGFVDSQEVLDLCLTHLCCVIRELSGSNYKLNRKILAGIKAQGSD